MNRKRVLALFLLVAVLFTFASCTKNTVERRVTEADASPEIVEVDVGIRPSAFRRMISNAEKTRYSVWVGSDDATYRGASINIRGSSSKEFGMLMPTKRIPFELVYDNGADAIPRFSNPSVKFINDPTPYHLLAEYIGLELFAASGIPTPEHAFSFIRFNDTDFGLYLAVEDVNKHFIAKHFDGNIGSLYKCSNNIEDGAYMHSPWFGDIFAKTDRGSQTLAALISALEKGSGFEHYLDMDEVLRFFACTAAVGGSGSILTEQNNFLLYDHGGKFVLLPWDVSESFYAFPVYNDDPDNNGIDRFYLEETTDLNPLFELIMRDPENRAKYHEYIREINDTFLAPERIKPYLLSIIRRIAPYLERDHTIYGKTPDLEKAMTTGTELYSENLLAVLIEMHKQLHEQLDGKAELFYFNDTVFTMPTILQSWEWYEALTTSTEDYNSAIVDQVCDGYTGWLSGFIRHDLFPAQKGFFLSALLFVPCLLIVLFWRRILLLRDTCRNKRNSPHPEDTSFHE